MKEDTFLFLYHSKSKEARVPIPKDPSKWPEEWHTVYYKKYPRLPKIVLDDVLPQADLFSVLQKRKSRREFSDIAINKKELSALLLYAAGRRQRHSSESTARTYPSAGERYPIEMYVLVQKSASELPKGLFHYDVENHQLDMLVSEKNLPEGTAIFRADRWYTKAPVVLFTTAVFWRSEHKYGERAYRLMLL